jgi:hypothetical protein
MGKAVEGLIQKEMNQRSLWCEHVGDWANTATGSDGIVGYFPVCGESDAKNVAKQRI